MNNHDCKKENSILYLEGNDGNGMAPQITSVCYTATAPAAKLREEEKKIQGVRKTSSKCWSLKCKSPLNSYLTLANHVKNLSFISKTFSKR